MEKPEGLKEDHLIFLDDLRESGVVNMWGAGLYLMDGFPDLSDKQASQIHTYWMKTFSERHPK